MSEFFAMGGHGAFVWTTYGLTFGGLTAMGVLSLLRLRRLRQEAAELREELEEDI